MSKYFYHGVMSFFPCQSMLHILQSGGLKSKRLQGNFDLIGYNGLDSISLCRTLTKEEYDYYEGLGYKSAYEIFIVSHFCFIIREDIEAIRTDVVAPHTFSSSWELGEYLKDHPTEHISDLVDEWQALNFIPNSQLIGIGIPLSIIQKGARFNAYREGLKELYEVATSLGLDIVDTTSPNFISSYEKRKENLEQIIDIPKKSLRYRRKKDE